METLSLNGDVNIELFVHYPEIERHTLSTQLSIIIQWKVNPVNMEESKISSIKVWTAQQKGRAVGMYAIALGFNSLRQD